MVDSLRQQTNNDTIQKYCYGNKTANCNTYGGLYQWNEAMQYSTVDDARGICPEGWHIPTYTELEELGGSVGWNANGLKSIGQGIGSGAGTNTSGFSGILSGMRNFNGKFMNLGYGAYFWASTESTTLLSYYLNFSSTDQFFRNPTYFKDAGYYVRCLRDR